MSSLSELNSDVHHIYVFGDFGRDATYNFCQRFINYEKEILQKKLCDNDFYDEYRRSMLTVHSYLPMIKEKQINDFLGNGKYIDDTVLIGFPNGMCINDAIEKFCVMLIPFLLTKKHIPSQLIISLPCNTLSPALVKVNKTMSDINELQRLSNEYKLGLDKGDLQRIDNSSVRYITVAEAVIDFVTHVSYKYVLPLGTSDISNIYAAALNRLDSKIELITPNKTLQDLVFKVIKASITNSESEIDSLKEMIMHEIAEINAQYEGEIAVVEACTDLNMGIGLNSLSLYSKYIADQVYL